MKDTLQYIVTQIVEHPSDVTIEEKTDTQRTVFVIHTHPDDTGRVIGKQGRIISALRDIIKLMATMKNTYVDVTIAEKPLV